MDTKTVNLVILSASFPFYEFSFLVIIFRALATFCLREYVWSPIIATLEVTIHFALAKLIYSECTNTTRIRAGIMLTHHLLFVHGVDQLS